MAQPQGFRIETPENAEANARINHEAVAKEIAMARRILERYEPEAKVLHKFQRDPWVQKELARIFGKKLGYEVTSVHLYKKAGDRIAVVEGNGKRVELVDSLERQLVAEIDLVAHTQADRYYTKRMQELYPLAYYRAHQYGKHSVN